MFIPIGTSKKKWKSEVKTSLGAPAGREGHKLSFMSISNIKVAGGKNTKVRWTKIRNGFSVGLEDNPIPNESLFS